MIDLYVDSVTLGGPMIEVVIPPQAYQMWPCPICKTDKESILLSEVRAGELTSMESAYCTTCEHRYFRKMPNVDWLNQYYADEFDAGRTDLTKPPQDVKATIKQWPAIDAAWGKISQIIHREEPAFRQIRAFLEGVIETNGNYYLRRTDIKKVLEIGCGYGAKLKIFKRLGYETYGVEAGRQRAEACRRQGLKVFDCPIVNLGLADQHGPYDFVYSIHVLEHIADISAHFVQLSSLVRDGGILYIQVPNIWLGEVFFLQSHAAVHCHTFSLHSLASLMREHGFTPVRVQADSNLHILASKMPPDDPQPGWKDSANYPQLLECLSRNNLQNKGRYRLTFDHSDVQLTCRDNGEVLYKRNVCFAVQKTPYSHSVDFSLASPTQPVSFPVRFLYDREQPPVWIKRQ